MENIKEVEKEIRAKVEKYGIGNHWVCSSIGGYTIDGLMDDIFSDGHWFPSGNYIHKTESVVNNVIKEIKEYIKMFDENEDLWNMLRNK